MIIICFICHRKSIISIIFIPSNSTLSFCTYLSKSIPTLAVIDITSGVGQDNNRDLSHKTVTAEMQAYLKENQKEEQKKEEHVVPLNDNFIVEPDMSTVLKLLIPKLAHLMLYTALLDSIASEHAARMVAMQTATDNADELLRELNLQYNKSRQQAITNELLDIVGGSVNN